MTECVHALFLVIRGMEGRAISERTPEVDDARQAGFGRPATRIAGQCDRTRGGAVITAIGREDFVLTGVQAGHANRVLHRLSARYW